uniref:Serine protease n=1 Tax=Atrato Sobemo-like virus 1 TaxID=2689347 RepID=A0A6B9KH45_9VIRU|nr:hypothetical protein [Atrato Sobemo-like virus 1]QHA33895.1 hypothetical protein [Atrato Sobemo-like virus 1]
MVAEALQAQLPVLLEALKSPPTDERGAVLEVMRRGFAPVLGASRNLLFRVGGQCLNLAWRDRTIIERIGVVGLSFMAWRNRGHLRRCAVELVSQVVPGVAQIRSFFGPRVVCARKNNPESRRPGSSETSMTVPNCQVKIATFQDSVYVVLGASVRFSRTVETPGGQPGHWLVGPDHVLTDDAPKFAFNDPTKVIRLAGRERILLAADLVGIKLDNNEMSLLSARAAKIGDFADPGTMAQIVGPDSKGTTGRLSHDACAFGKVIYDGTTVPGYSGAAYTDGSRVLGIHQGGGAHNYGVAASFIWGRICLYEKTIHEDSRKFLETLFERDGELRWTNVGDPMYIQIQDATGKYSIVERASVESTFGPGWDASNTIKRRRRRGYDDHLESALSGEATASNLLGGSRNVVLAQGCATPNLQSLMNEYNNLSADARKDFRKWLQAYPKVKSVMNGPVSAEAPAS